MGTLARRVQRRSSSKGREEIGGGGARGTFEERSSILEQGGNHFVEGRADSSVEPGGPGVELLRQLGLKEDGRLSAQGRHFAEAYPRTISSAH